MIDCLSAPAWIEPQINVLLFLQHFRVGILEHFDKFFLSITIFGEFWLPTLICAIAYWCVDFRAGVYLFGLESINLMVAHFFKMIACVYRPWILDSSLHPSELAIPYAIGYSFPSGHSAMSSSVLGGVAYVVRKRKLLCALLIGLILLIGFSRLWLGVHTPQDVVVGLFIGFTLVFALKRIIDWAEENKNRYLYLLGIINILAFLAIIYVVYFNTCRADYINGELLVNPQKSIYVMITTYGFSLGIINGCFLCRRFFSFNPKDASVLCRVIRGIVGATVIISLLKFVLMSIVVNPVTSKLAFLLMFIAGMSITLFYPYVFINAEKCIAKLRSGGEAG